MSRRREDLAFASIERQREWRRFGTGSRDWRVTFEGRSGGTLAGARKVARRTATGHGIHKKTQKTPAADLELARRRMKEGT